MAESGQVSTQARLDHDQVEPERKVRRICCLEPPPGGQMEAPPLAPFDRLLREPEVAPGAPTNLDDH